MSYSRTAPITAHRISAHNLISDRPAHRQDGRQAQPPPAGPHKPASQAPAPAHPGEAHCRQGSSYLHRHGSTPNQRLDTPHNAPPHLHASGPPSLHNFPSLQQAPSLSAPLKAPPHLHSGSASLSPLHAPLNAPLHYIPNPHTHSVRYTHLHAPSHFHSPPNSHSRPRPLQPHKN